MIRAQEDEEDDGTMVVVGVTEVEDAEEAPLASGTKRKGTTHRLFASTVRRRVTLNQFALRRKKITKSSTRLRKQMSCYICMKLFSLTKKR